MKSSFLSLSIVNLFLYYVRISKAQPTQGTIQCGDEITGSIELGERKYYSVQLTSNYNSIGFDGCDSNFDLELYLYDNANDIPNSPIAQCDDCNNVGRNSGCNHQWATDLLVPNVLAINNYIFAVGGWNDVNAGDYVIQLICTGGNNQTPAPTTTTTRPTTTTQSATSISCGETITGSLAIGASIYYDLLLAQGYNNLEFEGCESYFDLDLSLETPSGTELARCDACHDISPNEGCNDQWATDLQYGPINAGLYRFGIGGYQNAAGGQYQITLQCKEIISNECAEGNHRFRKSWNDMTENERDLYIRGFKILADDGIVQDYTQSHIESAIHNHIAFLSWHRHFVYLMENEIRNLGGEFACFAMPYWDWAAELSPSEVSNWRDELIILNSGLGSDSNNECLNDGSLFDSDNYTPYTNPLEEDFDCLIRDLDYNTNGISDCSFTTHQAIMGDYVDEYTNFQTFAEAWEGTPHALPHICIGGGNHDGANGQMVTFYSPADPIFYLHHSFIDYVFSLWQDCHNYENNIYLQGTMTFEPLPESYNVNARDTFHIINDYDYSYEKGELWTAGHVADIDDDDCGVTSGSQPWFTDFEPNDRRRIPGVGVGGNGGQMKRKRRADIYGMEIYELLMAGQQDRMDRDNNGNNGNNPIINKNKTKHVIRRKDISHKWAKLVCEQEEYIKGKICEKPIGYYDNCSGMIINSNTNDIDISLNELLEKEGITECMKETRIRYYKWAKQFGYLKYLCVGCYAPFCDQDFLQPICTNINAHYVMA